MSDPYCQVCPVKQAINLQPGMRVDGYFVYSNGAYPEHFLGAIDSLGTVVGEGVIGVLPSETNYTSPEGLNLLPQLTSSGVALNGLMTFGASGKAYNGDSHLSVVARELSIPFCIAKRPSRYIERVNELEWLQIQKTQLSPLHGLLGSMTLTRDGQNVVLMSS